MNNKPATFPLFSHCTGFCDVLIKPESNATIVRWLVWQLPLVGKGCQEVTHVSSCIGGGSRDTGTHCLQKPLDCEKVLCATE